MAAIVHVKRRLTNVSLHWPYEFQSIGELFFPRFGVEYLTDQFVQANKANLLAIRELSPLSDDDTPPEVQLVWDADQTFSCQVYGVASPGKWVTTKNADPALDYETERTITLTQALRLRLEYLQVKQRLRDATVMTNTSTLTSAQQFDNYTSSQSLPVKTLQIICDNLAYANGGRPVNRMAMTKHVLRAICRSEDFRDQVKYQAIINATELAKTPNGQAALLEQLIGLAPGSITIADHVYNSAAQGQTPVYKAFMGSDVVVGYVEPLGLRKWTLSAGFQWNAYDSNPTSIISVPQYNRGTVPTEELRAFSVIDPKVIKPELGFLLKGTLNTSNADYNGLLD